MLVLSAVQTDSCVGLYGDVRIAQSPLERAIRHGRNPMTAQVALLILAPDSPAGEHAIAARLAQMGGRLTDWRPQIGGAPARAYFVFDSEEECERFIAKARRIAGVSLEARD